ncbi:MAG TPA: tetrathionate reductase subunit C, partial [Leclercia adecarboxylata]|nr:tetrathionate reductase subunit C [Leclercia adecarboxylata]
GAVLLAWYLGDTLSGEALRQQWRLGGEIRLYLLTLMLLWTATLAVSLYASRYKPPFFIALASTLLVAILCWTLRWTVLMGGQIIPKFNALMNDYSLPMGTDGLLAIIGTFGLWLALAVVLGECVTWLSRRYPHA